MTVPKLKPCPFCKYAPTIEPWHGGSKRKRAVHCVNEDCPVHLIVTRSTAARAAAAWNTRPVEDALLAAMDALVADEETSDTRACVSIGAWSAFLLAIAKARGDA